MYADEERYSGLAPPNEADVTCKDSGGCPSVRIQSVAAPELEDIALAMDSVQCLAEKPSGGKARRTGSLPATMSSTYKDSLRGAMPWASLRDSFAASSAQWRRHARSASSMSESLHSLRLHGRRTSWSLVLLAVMCMAIGALLNRHIAPVTVALDASKKAALAQELAEQRVHAAFEAEARARALAHEGRQAEARAERRAQEALRSEAAARAAAKAAIEKLQIAESALKRAGLDPSRALEPELAGRLAQQEGAISEDEEPTDMLQDGADPAKGSVHPSHMLVLPEPHADDPRFPKQLLSGHAFHEGVWSPDGRILATAARDDTVRLWKVDDKGAVDPSSVQVLDGHSDWVWSMAYSPNGQSLATAGYDGLVYVWAVLPNGTVDAAAPQVLEGHTDPVRSVAWSPDSRRLASAAWDNTIRVWHVGAKGEIDGEAPEVLKGHTGWIYSVAWSWDGSFLASASWDNSIRVWPTGGDGLVDAGRSMVLQGHKNFVNSVAWAPGKLCFASGADDGTVRIWSIPGNGRGFSDASPQVLRNHRDFVNSVAWSRDGKTLATASADKTVMLWNVTNRLRGECHIDADHPVVLSGHKDWVTSVSFDPDGKRLASSSADQTLRVWHMDDHSL